METWSAHQLFSTASKTLSEDSASSLRRYAEGLKKHKLPVVFTLNHLSEITGVPFLLLKRTVNRQREVANYKMFTVSKHSGGRRYIHSVHKHLHTVHQFLNREILQKTEPHYAAHAFHSSGGIRKCAEKHCGARWLFKFDIQDFFYSINEVAVFEVFRKLGYRPLLAFEMARLCTTTRLPRSKRHLLWQYDWHDYDKYRFYKAMHLPIGVLPQGAATSPMLSNLVAMDMDNFFERFALDLNLVYTRYADDISFSSASSLPLGVTKGKFIRMVKSAMQSYGFIPNKSKTRVAGPGSQKLVLGLLVDGDRVRLAPKNYRKIERLLYASQKFGVDSTSQYEGFDSALGFYNHLSGLVAFTKDVDMKRWNEFRLIFQKLEKPTEY